MAKKTTAKKSKRRLKRTVRRSMAAVLMITAVVVAAIPVPENAAADPAGGITTYADPEPLPYSYRLDLPSTVANKDLAQPGDGAGNVHTANIIQALSDGSYQMDWQFKFKMTTVNNRERGIITKYNNSYAEQRVELRPNVTCDYVQFTQKQFDDYFAPDSTTSLTYSCTNPTTIDSETAEFFDAYFKTAFDTYKRGYDAAKKEYDEEYQRWQDTVTPDNPNGTFDKPKPPSFSRSTGDLTLDDKYVYFCDHYQNGRYKGYQLASVIDSANPGPNGTNTRVYIPQRPEKQKVGEMDDAQGFVYQTDASIIGIGNEAFKGTKNVLYLTVPDEIKYIGKSAFEDSFLREITLVNTEQICDNAFKNCHDLTKVDMRAGVTQIGTECFYDTGVLEVSFPSSMSMIGHGAFAYCKSLGKVNFSNVSGNVAIGDYAFYNTVGLNEVNFLKEGSESVTASVNRIGEGAFAVEDGVTGNMTDFLFPTTIKKALSSDDIEAEGIGDYALAGRTSLLRVIMPSDFGRNPTPTAKVPDNTFYNCFNLEYVKFPADSYACGYATFSPEKLFASVSNSDFYVWGPELNARREYATPREQTWDAVTALDGVSIPYRYDRGEQQFYEICGGDNREYLMCIDNDGVLTSCTRKDRNVSMSQTVPMKIPAKVGEKEVTAIGPGCFSDDELNQHINEVTIEDNSKIASIAASVFKDWKELRKVYIGNSITQIGASAFEGCEKLVDVTFSSPLGGHESVEPFGENAFKTGSPELTFHGDIVIGYAPFAWAMNKDNIIKEPEGIRVCYQSLSPTFLTVMYDENTDLVTLLDYPKMNQVSDLLNEAHAKEIKDGKYGTYENMREQLSYLEYSSEAYNSRREAFKAAWQANGEEAYQSEFYGPWITDKFCTPQGWNSSTTNPATSGESTTTPDGGEGDEGGGTTTGKAIADFFLEPITAYAAEETPTNLPDPYYARNHFEVGKSTAEFPSLTAEEIGLLNAVRNIVVPDGVDSIDVFGYITKSDRNKLNAETYLQKKLDPDVWRMYYNSGKVINDTDGNATRIPGLFSGYYDEELGDDKGEKYKRGNDQITSVTLNSVKYLPDYAFDSCENLLSVDLGPACSNIGTAPFRGCYEMSTVGDNEYYTAANGIIYSKNEDGSLTIEECLAARGRKTEAGPAIVIASNDENLKSVSAIKPGAFEDCDFLTEVNFGSRDTAGLLVIPEDCFRNCDSLQTVVLPVTVNDIGRNAFAGANNLSGLTVHGNEVKISGRAFDTNKTVWTTVRANEDSAVVRYVKEYGDEYHLQMDSHPFGREWKVTFYDARYQLAEDMKDDLGEALDNPQYVTNGEKAAIPAAPELEGWTFDEWVGMNGADIRQPIRSDTIFYAQGHYANGAPVNGKYTVEFFDGIDGSPMRGFGAESDGKYYVDAGKSFADMGFEAPAHKAQAGYEPMGYRDYRGEWTVNTVTDRNLSVILLYSASSTSGGSTSGGSTSGGTTSSGTTSGGSTNNTSKNSGSNSSSKNSSSSSSSSTSSSSTSTTSTTTSGAGQYTVFVDGGSGSGSYAPGTTVIISCYTPAEGMRFSNWTTDSNGVTLASASMTVTTFTMPSNNVTVKANYVEAPAAPAVAVNTGGGGGTGNTTGNTGDTTGGNGNTRVDIEKPGISNRDLATANTNGSTDNFIVKISETDEATRAVAAALTNKYGTLDNILYYAMDISLYDSTGTTKITDTTGLSVDITIPIPDSLVAYGGNNMAGAVINGDQLESLNENFTTINGVPCIRFRAEHFSPYTIYVDTGNLVEGMLDVTPKTGDPIHPKWFLSLGLACLSVILFMKRDRKVAVKAK